MNMQLTQTNQTADQDSIKSSTSHPLSPDTRDVAVSSFSPFHGPAAPRRAVPQNPPDHVLTHHKGGRIASLDEMAADTVPPTKRDDDETEDELFAVKLSPRSPEMTKSPFSFSAKDTLLG
jgi:hypothetical protein